MNNVKVGDKVIVKTDKGVRIMHVVNDYYNEYNYLVVMDKLESIIIARYQVIAIIEQLGV